MKKLCSLLLMLLLLCSCQSKEEKAAELISKELYKTLYDYSSYEPIETIVSEARLSAYTDTTIYKESLIALEIEERLKRTAEECEDAISSMKIWEPSYYSSSYSNSKYYEYKKQGELKLEEAKLYLAEYLIVYNHLKDTIPTLDSTKIVGWEVRHRFRCKTKGGYNAIGDYRYVIDEDFKQILLYEDIDDDKYNSLRSLINSIINDNSGEK